MRFGHWRGVTLAFALLASLTASRSVSADSFGHTIPPEVLARDLNTGGPYMAPPIPWGHYAKSGFGDHFGKKCPLCGLFKGHGAGQCGGHGLFGKGGMGCGLFNHDGGCGDPGCGSCKGLGHGKRIKDCGLCKGKGCGICTSSPAGDPFHTLASSQSPAPVATSPQVVPMATSQGCSEPGCGLGKGDHHGGSSMGDPCGSCGGKGCGLCGGLGKIFHKGTGCDSCGGKGCGKCGLFSGGKGCSNCGGRGCGLCAGLKGKLSSILHPHGGKIKYFVGPGGPVPLTPGYVPYVVTTRSPRDFLAFPPYTPDGF
jgi:hypothetical protein